MTEIEVEGKTVEDAIREGLQKLGCSKEDVEVKILNEGTAGLFGLMGTKPACVKLIAKDGVELKPVDFTLAQERVKEILHDILKLMNVGYSEINTALLAGRILAEIKTPEGNLLIGKSGQTLEALELILNLILNRDKNTRTKVSLDTEEYRHKQEEHLQAMATKAAEQVKQSGKIFRFDPMPSRDRKVIHMYLKSDTAVETFSEGEGPFRKVGVKPK